MKNGRYRFRCRFSLRAAAVFACILALMVAVVGSCEGIHLANEDGTQLTAGQQALDAYLTRVNETLAEKGCRQINTVYECRKTFAVVGISDNGGELPEDMDSRLAWEITFQLNDDDIASVQIVTENVSEFSGICAAMISCGSPDASFENAKAAADSYASRALKEPGNSFEDAVDTTRGDSLRCYYAYFPNQYMDGTNWIQLTMVFPLTGFSGVMLTPSPTVSIRYQGDADAEYEGYGFDGSDYHYEFFTTPTPEPEIDFSKK